METSADPHLLNLVETTHPATQNPTVQAGNPSLTLTPVSLPTFSNYAHHLWLSFSVHEHLNTQRGIAEYTSYVVVKVACGMPKSLVAPLKTHLLLLPYSQRTSI